MTDVERKEMCPRCGANRLRKWSELTIEEREAARRLSVSANEVERRQRARWCTQCWYEDADRHSRVV